MRSIPRPRLFEMQNAGSGPEKRWRREDVHVSKFHTGRIEHTYIHAVYTRVCDLLRVAVVHIVLHHVSVRVIRT